MLIISIILLKQRMPRVKMLSRSRVGVSVSGVPGFRGGREVGVEVMVVVMFEVEEEEMLVVMVGILEEEVGVDLALVLGEVEVEGRLGVGVRFK